MVILGGTATILGPVLGSAAFILLEEILVDSLTWVEHLLHGILGMEIELSNYWHLPFGLLLIVIVLYVRGGLMGLINRKED